MTSRSVRAGREPLPPPAEPGALDPPITEPEGNSLAWASPRLTTLAADLGCSLVIEPHSDGRGGCFVPDLKPISLNDANSINHQIKTFVHELSHSLLHQNDHDEVRLTYFQEELVVESIAPTVVGGLGLDTSCYRSPTSRPGARTRTPSTSSRLAPASSTASPSASKTPSVRHPQPTDALAASAAPARPTGSSPRRPPRPGLFGLAGLLLGLPPLLTPQLERFIATGSQHQRDRQREHADDDVFSGLNVRFEVFAALEPCSENAISSRA